MNISQKKSENEDVSLQWYTRLIVARRVSPYNETPLPIHEMTIGNSQCDVL